MICTGYSVVFVSLTHLASSWPLALRGIEVPVPMPIIIWGEDSPATALSPSGTLENTSFYPVFLKKPIYLAELLKSKIVALVCANVYMALYSVCLNERHKPKENG
jgi:hypothetical protein